MSSHGLTPKHLKARYASSVSKADTFETHGVSEQAAKRYLLTPEGNKFLDMLVGADPDASASEIRRRAIGQIRSGIELPRMELSSEPLTKIVPAGEHVSPFSPYFGRVSVFERALASGGNLSDHFALPIKSEAPRYDMVVTRPFGPTEIFIQRVAPTSELHGLVTKTGGGEQVLVPNRKLYSEPTYVKSIDNSLALQAERRVATAAKGVVAGSAAVLTAYDAYTTAEKYQALSAQGNEFGADALLRRYEGRTAGGFLGSLAAGATYGFVAGSETGPGAFLTGAAGGVIGAFAGEEIAKAINEHKINHQTGTDGVTYAYEDGQWGRTRHLVDLGSSGPANPYDAPNYTSTTTPAPDNQIEVLEYKRMTAVTELALANPATQDTKHVDLGGTRWHATRDGWARQVEMPGIPNAYGIPSSITVDKPADATTSQALNQIATNRRYNNDHYAADVANAYVMDYYGNGWAAHGALPDTVTKPLGLPSEQHIKDPVTGHVWKATLDGQFNREVDRSAGRVFIRERMQASGEVLNRLNDLQQAAIQSNADYGKRLIAEKFEASGIARFPAHVAHPDAMLATATDLGFHGNTPSNPSPSFENTAASKAVSSITPQSSNREMFAALVTAAQHVDIDAMRAVGQAYLQSPQGQAWLAQGQQFNQQQGQAQPQATLDAQQHVSAPQGAMR